MPCKPEVGNVELPAYAELHCLSNFTFLRGASHPHELIEQADALGYSALAITDECSVAGVVRAHMAAKRRQLKLIIGAEFRLSCGLKFVALAIDRQGYGQLCRLITCGRRAAPKGQYTLTRADVQTLGPEQCFILWLPGAWPQPEELRWLAGCFPDRVRIAVELLCDGQDSERLAVLTRIGAECGTELIARQATVRQRRALPARARPPQAAVPARVAGGFRGAGAQLPLLSR
jgi:error-prone DNA polymerase